MVQILIIRSMSNAQCSIKSETPMPNPKNPGGGIIGHWDLVIH